jgi:hypothetical protein
MPNLTEEQKTYRRFKSELTRLTRKQDHVGVIRLWTQFQTHYDTHGPWPDLWRNWERAAEDALYALRFQTRSF